MIFKFPIHRYVSFADLPFAELDTVRFYVYLLDYEWNYLFVNRSGKERLNGMDIVGKNIKTVWAENRNINFEPVFNLLKEGLEKKIPFEMKSISPISKKSIEIAGYPLSDCYYYSVTELPDKDALLSELRAIVKSSKG